MKFFFTIFLILLLFLLGPLLGWPALRTSSDLGLIIGVGLIVLGRHRWAWSAVLVAAVIDESRSVVPPSLHLIAAAIALSLAILAHRRLLSGHSQTQVSVLVLVALVAKQAAWLLFRGITVAVHGSWILPTVQAISQSIIPTVLWAVIVTFLIWPSISRRWLSLQRIAHWL